MGARFVKFGATNVNPRRVLFVTEVYTLGEINMGSGPAIKTGLPVGQVVKMLEEAMDDQPAAAPGQYSPEIVHKALLADVVRYLEEKFARQPARVD